MCSQTENSKESPGDLCYIDECFPEIEIVGECMGQTCPRDIPCIQDEDHLIVLKFDTYYPSQNAWLSFLHLVQIVTKWNSNVDLTSDDWIRIDVIKSTNSDLLIIIREHNVRFFHSLFSISNKYPIYPIAFSEQA